MADPKPKSRVFALYTDETNNEPSSEAKYFIYGGIIVPAENLGDIHTAVALGRSQSKFPDDKELKFSTNTRPASITPEKFAELKDLVVRVAIQNDVRFIAYLVPHAIAAGQDTAKRIEFGLNTVLLKFQQFLEENNGKGLVFIDRPPIEHPYKYMADVFQKGLPFRTFRQFLPDVCCYSITCSGASHVHSLIDIILGGFRYCVNASRETEFIREFLPKVMGMMWGKVEGGKKNISERGLVIRPKEKMAVQYRQPIDELIAHLIEVANRKLGKR